MSRQDDPPGVYALEILYNLQQYAGRAVERREQLNAAHVSNQLAVLAGYFEQADEEEKQARKPRQKKIPA